MALPSNAVRSGCRYSGKIVTTSRRIGSSGRAAPSGAATSGMSFAIEQSLRGIDHHPGTVEDDFGHDLSHERHQYGLLSPAVQHQQFTGGGLRHVRDRANDGTVGEPDLQPTQLVIVELVGISWVLQLRGVQSECGPA